MSPALAFTHQGHRVQMRTLTDGGAALWVAEVEGTDAVFVVSARADETARRVREQVRAWIDAGMPNGGASA